MRLETPFAGESEAADVRERRRRLTRFHAATHTRRHVVLSFLRGKERRREKRRNVARETNEEMKTKPEGAGTAP